jgi:hypothetical protein
MDASPSPVPSRPPFGSWQHTYLWVCVLAVAVMLLLYLFTEHYNVPMGKP